MNSSSLDRAPLAHSFVQFSVDAGVLRFGEFKTKAGRMSPYFFNAGLFNDGAKLGRLAEFYARRLICLLYTSPSPRDVEESRMPSSA